MRSIIVLASRTLLFAMFAATAASLVLTAGCGSPRKSAENAYQRGLDLETKGDTARAAETYQRAIEIAEKAREGGTVARARARLGAMALARGDLRSALEHFDAGIAAAREAGGGEELGNLLNNAGLVKRTMGDLEGAESNYLEAVAETHRANNLLGEAAALNNLGAILRRRGDDVRARDLFLRALGVARLSNDSLTIARALISVGDFERSQVMHDDATQAFDQAIEALRPVDANAAEIGYAYLAKGQILEELGDEAGAQRLYLLAHAQYRNAGDRRGEAAAAAALGSLAVESSRMDEANRYLSEAAPTLREIGALPELSDVLVKLALVRRAAGDLGGSVTAYREALDARGRMGDASGAAMIHMNLGALFEGAGDFANAGMAYHQAREALVAVGDTAAARTATEAVLRMKERGAPALAPTPRP